MPPHDFAESLTLPAGEPARVRTHEGPRSTREGLTGRHPTLPHQASCGGVEDLPVGLPYSTVHQDSPCVGRPLPILEVTRPFGRHQGQGF